MTKLSVIMSVYNCEGYIEDSINSILSQTFNDFEFIVIDDCSCDETLNKVKAFKDTRLVIIENEANIGLTRSLNKAINISKGKYIARLDADDISYPERLEKQVKLLEGHSDIGVCSTWMQETGYGKGGVIKKTPLKHDEIVASFLRTNTIGHSSVLIRKSVLMDNDILYDEDYNYSQDYELWARLSKVTRFECIPEVLTELRLHPNSLSAEKRESQMEFGEMARISFYENVLGRPMEMFEKEMVMSDYKGKGPFKDVFAFLMDMVKGNRNTRIIPHLSLSLYCFKKLLKYLFT